MSPPATGAAAALRSSRFLLDQPPAPDGRHSGSRPQMNEIREVHRAACIQTGQNLRIRPTGSSVRSGPPRRTRSDAGAGRTGQAFDPDETAAYQRQGTDCAAASAFMERTPLRLRPGPRRHRAAGSW